jgi:hypothetical protein
VNFEHVCISCPVRELTIQLLAEARAAAGALIGKGAYSDGSNQGIASNPTAKKKLSTPSQSTITTDRACQETHLNKKSMVAATIPVPFPVTDVVPARTAIQAH